MLFSAYLFSILGIIFCNIPILGLIIATIGVVLFIIINKTKRYTTNKILLIFGYIISIIAFILCVIHTLILPLKEFLENSVVVNEAKVSVIKSQRQEIEQRIKLYFMLNKVTDKTKYIKEKLILSKVENDEIIYSSSSINSIKDKSFKEEIALSNSQTAYYKINSKNIEDLSSNINIDNFVIDLQGNVYINAKLD